MAEFGFYDVYVSGHIRITGMRWTGERDLEGTGDSE